MSLKKRAAVLLLSLLLTLSVFSLSSCKKDKESEDTETLKVEVNDDEEGWSPVWRP